MLSDYDGDPSALAKEVGSVDGPIPVLITRNLIPFPGVMTPILIGRQPSLKLLDYLRDHPDQTFAVFAQKDASVDYPIQEDLFEVGVYAKLVKEFEVPGSNNEHSAIVIASARCRLKSLDDANNFFTAETEMIPEVFPAEDDKEFAAAVEGLRQGVEIYVKMNDDIPNEAMVALQNISNHLSIVNFVASNIVSNIYDKIMLLEEDNMKLRLFKLLKVLNRETQFLHIKKNIQNKTRADIDEQQKEYFLHQQIKNIREELGDSGESEDKRELKKKAFLKPWPDEVSKLFAKELAKLDNINPQSPDYSVLLNYLQTLVSLPWGVYTKDRLDLKRAQRVLDRNHYGMEKVKERILEYMAVLRLRGDLKSPILCLYGPPGVGKTSLGKSVAEAMGRKYVRVSLGGLHDEAEVRGHRRTYIGAMPGRIIKSILKAGSSNPVFILDEIDKVTQNTVNGDPASALLEVLDPEQNNAFHDNYLDTDYDLSKVLFIATANDLNTIPRPYGGDSRQRLHHRGEDRDRQAPPRPPRTGEHGSRPGGAQAEVYEGLPGEGHRKLHPRERRTPAGEAYQQGAAQARLPPGHRRPAALQQDHPRHAAGPAGQTALLPRHLPGQRLRGRGDGPGLDQRGRRDPLHRDLALQGQGRQTDAHGQSRRRDEGERRHRPGVRQGPYRRPGR